MTDKVLEPVRLPNDWLSPEELRKLTPQSLAARVAALKPMIAAHAREAERQRKPVDEVWLALRKTGMFYHFVPKTHGGLEFSASDLIDVILPIAEACPATAWASSFVSIHNWIFACFPKQAQDEVFAKFPYVSAPGVNSPPAKFAPAEGGYRVTGRFKWGTGVMHSDWVMALGIVSGTKPPRALFCAMPIDQVKILDTWRSDGMIATGSHDILIEDVFVPEHMTLDAALMRTGESPGGKHNAHNPMYSAPSLPILVLTAAISAVGAARAAVEFYKGHMQKRVQFATTTSTSERVSTQMRLGHADLLAREAEILLRDMAQKYEARMLQPGLVPVSERLALRAQAAYAVQVAKRCIDVLCEAAGAGAHSLDNPLQRYLRDVSVLSAHVAFDLDLSLEQHGRTMLGLEPTSAYT